MDKSGVAYTDGSSKGNPGESGIGVLILDPKHNVLKEVSRYIGIATNNVAEYEAVILALTEARSLGMRKIEIRTDSKLLSSQLKGEYKIKDPKLRTLAVRCMRLLRTFGSSKITLVPRKDNSRADRLAQAAIDSRREQAG